MQRMKSWEIITNIGNKVKQNWQNLADKHKLEIDQWGLSALAGFNFVSPQQSNYKTYITQELLKKGYLGANSIYACIHHTDTILEGYFHQLDSIFERIGRCHRGLENINDLLDGKICQSGFGRLN